MSGRVGRYRHWVVRHAALDVEPIEDVGTIEIEVFSDERGVHGQTYVTIGDNSNQLIVLEDRQVATAVTIHFRQHFA